MKMQMRLRSSVICLEMQRNWRACIMHIYRCSTWAKVWWTWTLSVLSLIVGLNGNLKLLWREDESVSLCVCLVQQDWLSWSPNKAEYFHLGGFVYFGGFACVQFKTWDGRWPDVSCACCE
jgi:hypothetical protein